MVDMERYTYELITPEGHMLGQSADLQALLWERNSEHAGLRPFVLAFRPHEPVDCKQLSHYLVHEGTFYPVFEDETAEEAWERRVRGRKQYVLYDLDSRFVRQYPEGD